MAMNGGSERKSPPPSLTLTVQCVMLCSERFLGASTRQRPAGALGGRGGERRVMLVEWARMGILWRIWELCGVWQDNICSGGRGVCVVFPSFFRWVRCWAFFGKVKSVCEGMKYFGIARDRALMLWGGGGLTPPPTEPREPMCAWVTFLHGLGRDVWAFLGGLVRCRTFFAHTSGGGDRRRDEGFA